MSEILAGDVAFLLCQLSVDDYFDDETFIAFVNDESGSCEINVQDLAEEAARHIGKLEAENAALKKENERLAGEHKLLRERLHLANSIIDDQDPITATLKARVAELEKERQTLADAAYSAIIAFNNLQDESLDGEARAHALLKHTDCIRNLWNIFAAQDNARFKEPSNEG